MTTRQHPGVQYVVPSVLFSYIIYYLNIDSITFLFYSNKRLLHVLLSLSLENQHTFLVKTDQITECDCEVRMPALDSKLFGIPSPVIYGLHLYFELGVGVVFLVYIR